MISKKDNARSNHLVPTFVILGLVLLSLVMSGLSLRDNSLMASKLKSEVINLDKTGASDLPAKLSQLKNQVTNHMNTPLVDKNGIKPPIQLSGSYARAKAAEQKRVSDYNVTINADAQKNCESKFGPGQVQPRLACNSEYVSAKGIKEKTILVDYYYYDFVSPSWSPDLAGFSALFFALSSVWLLSRLVFDFFYTKLVG
jgi:hypothetical protein